MRRRRFLSLLAVAGLPAATVTFLLVRALTTGAQPAQGVSSCLMSPAALISQAQLTAFTDVVTQRLNGPPIPGGIPAAVATFSNDYVGGRLVGFVANIAIQGPDRPLEDAYARSLGYPPGRIPLVPLSGAIVRDSPGLLEVYESVYVYGSESQADSLARLLHQSLLVGGSHVAIAGVPADDGYFLPAPTTGPNPPYESAFQVVAVANTSVLRVSLQGGSELTVTDAAQITREAVARMGLACPRDLRAGLK